MTGLLTAWPVDLGILAAMFLIGGALTLRPFCAWCDGDPFATCECVGDCRRRCCPLGAGLETAHRALLDEEGSR